MPLFLSLASATVYCSKPKIYCDLCSLILTRIGICDCCDGSDETGNPFGTVCNNVCGEILSSRKQALVSNYHKIKEGRMARSKLIDGHQRQILREEKMLESLSEELSDMDALKLSINRWLIREQPKETWSRLAILRRFESECASGTYEACHIQDEGVNPELHLFRQIIGGGYEDIELDSDEASQAAAHARESDERKKRQQQRAATGESTGSLTGRDRVMATECPKQSYEIITEARVARIHDNLAEYLHFTDGKAGAAARKLTLEQTRRSTTLFGPFLESRNGPALAAQITSELLGIAIIPTSITIYMATSIIEKLFNLFTYSMKECAVIGKPSLKYVKVLEEAGTIEILTEAQLKVNAAADAVDWDDEENEPLKTTWLQFFEDFWSGDYIERKYRHISKMVSAMYAQTLSTTCSVGLVSKAAAIYYEQNLPGGQISTVVEQLDYTRYPLIMDTMQEIWGYTSDIRWVFSIAYRSPYMWLRFLFTSSERSLLPVRRDACTLRAAWTVLHEEYASVMDRLAEETKLAKQKRSQRPSASDSPLKRNNDNGLSHSGIESSVIYGPSKVWEAVATSDCLSARIHSHKYTLCLFGEVKQDRKIVGKFSGWSQSMNVTNEGTIEPSKLNQLFEAGGHSMVPMLHRMMYTDGEFCQAGGRHRQATVHLMCADTASIAAVDEIEVYYIHWSSLELPVY